MYKYVVHIVKSGEQVHAKADTAKVEEGLLTLCLVDGEKTPFVVMAFATGAWDYFRCER